MISSSIGGSKVVDSAPQYSLTVKVGEMKLILSAEVVSPSPKAMTSIVKVSVMSDSLDVQNTKS